MYEPFIPAFCPIILNSIVSFSSSFENLIFPVEAVMRIYWLSFCLRKYYWFPEKSKYPTKKSRILKYNPLKFTEQRIKPRKETNPKLRIPNPKTLKIKILTHPLTPILIETNRPPILLLRRPQQKPKQKLQKPKQLHHNWTKIHSRSLSIHSSSLHLK